MARMLPPDSAMPMGGILSLTALPGTKFPDRKSVARPSRRYGWAGTRRRMETLFHGRDPRSTGPDPTCEKILPPAERYRFTNGLFCVAWMRFETSFYPLRRGTE